MGLWSPARARCRRHAHEADADDACALASALTLWDAICCMRIGEARRTRPSAIKRCEALPVLPPSTSCWTTGMVPPHVKWQDGALALTPSDSNLAASRPTCGSQVCTLRCLAAPTLNCPVLECWHRRPAFQVRSLVHQGLFQGSQGTWDTVFNDRLRSKTVPAPHPPSYLSTARGRLSERSDADGHGLLVEM